MEVNSLASYLWLHKAKAKPEEFLVNSMKGKRPIVVNGVPDMRCETRIYEVKSRKSIGALL